MNSPQDQMVFMVFWILGQAFVALLAIWRSRNGIKNRRFWHPFYQVDEASYPTWFKLEKAMTVMIAAVASLFFAVGVIVLLGLLLGKLS